MNISSKTKVELSRLISVKEAADKLDKSEARIRQYIAQGKLPCLRLGVVIDPDDLDRIELMKRGRKKKKK